MDKKTKSIPYRRSFLLGIMGILISSFSFSNRSFGFITYPLITLSILVILLGFWQLYQSRKK